MRPPTIVKAGIGWTGSTVSWADRKHTGGKECISTLPQRDKRALGWEQKSTTYRTGLFQGVSWSSYKSLNNLCQYHQGVWFPAKKGWFSVEMLTWAYFNTLGGACRIVGISVERVSHISQIDCNLQRVSLQTVLYSSQPAYTVHCQW